jgi:predicted patatin/cPLA2 family phospholipase
LVIECGGMRGVAAAGIVTELERWGGANAFDSVHGSSAGACAAAYFVSQRSDDGAQIFMKDIATRRVVDHKRFLSQPCMVDTDYIVDTIISDRRPLDLKRIVGTPSKLFIVTTSLKEAKPVILSGFRRGADVLTALKASLRVPGPFEHGIEFEGDRHLDGGIAAPIAIDSAISNGATHILIAGTQRRKDYFEKDRRSLEPIILRILYGSAVQQAYHSGAEQRRTVIDARTFMGAEVDSIFRSDDSPLCHWHTIDKTVLEIVRQDAAKSAHRYIKHGNLAA